MPVSVKSSYTTTKAVCKRVLLYTTVYLPHILKSSSRFILHSDGNDDIDRISAAACARKQTNGRKYRQTDENTDRRKKIQTYRKKIKTDGRKYRK